MSKDDDTSKHYDTTVVFADVAGSSKLYKEVGNDEANRRINNIIKLISDVTRKHNGMIIKTIGDELMCHFTDANSAYDAVVAMQKVGEETLPLRIGLSWGRVIEKDADIFGEAVNDAAAVTKIARARQIITTDYFKQQLSNEKSENLSQFDVVKLKGGQESTKIFRIEWESGTSTQRMGAAKQTVIMSAVGTIQNQLILSYHLSSGKTDSITLTPTSNVPLHIGRDTDCQLPIDSPLASRDHCHIDYQHGKFVLKDHSTNGTYVKNGEGQQVYLRRQETPLLGKGEISLGEAVSDDRNLVIHYLG